MTQNKFGWAIHKYENGQSENSYAPRQTVYTFTFREDAEEFKTKNPMLARAEIRASYEMVVPEYGQEGVVYEVHTRVGGGAGVEPAGLLEWPHSQHV